MVPGADDTHSHDNFADCIFHCVKTILARKKAFPWYFLESSDCSWSMALILHQNLPATNQTEINFSQFQEGHFQRITQPRASALVKFAVSQGCQGSSEGGEEAMWTVSRGQTWEILRRACLTFSIWLHPLSLGGRVRNAENPSVSITWGSWGCWCQCLLHTSGRKPSLDCLLESLLKTASTEAAGTEALEHQCLPQIHFSFTIQTNCGDGRISTLHPTRSSTLWRMLHHSTQTSRQRPPPGIPNCLDVTSIGLIATIYIT